MTFRKCLAYVQNVSIPKNPKIISQSITNEKATLIWEKPDKYDIIKNYNIYQDGQKIGDANSGSNIAKECFDRFYNDDSNSNAVKITEKMILKHWIGNNVDETISDNAVEILAIG
ncbi:hypothetical protein psyc5s11_19230 [Clostridium gelidum]|uniref:Fibronectin type-III domain-containing protein n=1 Tax=Clostridium gelidum TaxID=704125 RepID=A0ABN6IYN1_9CLOT|nr:hypothetical protein [Clostridium gelidum]BCZ45856.1 hypothetical protein psyc5s11_19230 [Clostridium gelidum]